MIDRQGHIKLIDFGLARENVIDSFSSKSFCGTPAYISPEMLKKKGIF